MENLVLTSLLLGFVLGLAHAFDPDHLVAVGTLAVNSESVHQSSLFGVFWGAGHTVTLAVVGGTVLSLKLTIPAHLATGMEVIVAGMIILLGASLLWHSSSAWTLHSHSHAHGDSTHVHLHVHPLRNASHNHHLLSSWRKAFTIGMVHGLAGSAALSLAVMSTMPSTVFGVLYIVLFGIGSIGGMLMMSAVMSLPFVLTAGFWSPRNDKIKALVGLLAMVFGGHLAWTLLV